MAADDQHAPSQGTDNDGVDAEELIERIQELARRSGRLFERLLEPRQPMELQVPDPRVVGETLARLGDAMLADPERLIEAQARYLQDMGALWQQQMRRMLGEENAPMVAPDPTDRRFKDPAWQEDLVFDYLRQSYQLTARWMESTVAEVRGLDTKTHAKARFYTRQYVDAIAPSNFPTSNPTVIREAVRTKGESLYRGLCQLLDDLERSHGPLRVSMTRNEAFSLGENVAVTPGAVVFENEMMQLIQYAPTTERVMRRPLLIVPPWINKFYILDLRPKNSLIRWAVEQGITVFVVSWVNPDERLAEKDFADYLLDGPWAAAQAIERQTGERELNIVGYCLGGTLTAVFLAWLTARGDGRVKSATFLTTMLDFAEPGELGVFIDDLQMALLERHMDGRGYLEARYMQQVFSLMRANDLIWSFFVNNYLMGREPIAFDLLFWNGDGTRMPRRMHSFYLRNMYDRNLLMQPGAIDIDGIAIDIRTVRVPAYFLSTEDDHIAPWRSTYAGARTLGGKVRFVLGGSGHIAGVVNPATSGKYGYRAATSLPREPAEFQAAATRHEGSWWPDWLAWLRRRSGGWQPARQVDSGTLAVIEPAPGRYVRTRADD